MRDGKPSQSALRAASSPKGRAEKTCPICGSVFFAGHNAQKYCCKECADIGRKQQSKAARKKRKTMVKIKIKRFIPVFPELMPVRGKVYKAKKCAVDKSAAFYIIPDICGKQIIVRVDECVEV